MNSVTLYIMGVMSNMVIGHGLQKLDLNFYFFSILSKNDFLRFYLKCLTYFIENIICSLLCLHKFHLFKFRASSVTNVILQNRKQLNILDLMLYM